MRLPAFFALLFAVAAAQAAPLEPILLWPGGAPGALGDKDDDKPTLTAYLPAPDKATGAAIVICPGGGYGGLAPHEGAGYAEWLAENGVAGLVLKYRLGSKGYRHPAMLNDAARAVRLARSQGGGVEDRPEARSASWDRAPAAISRPRCSRTLTPERPAMPTPSSARVRGRTSASSATP